MNEQLLQYIWQHQLFNRGDLRTEDGEAVSILYAGSFNRDQGPDFLDARVMIGNTTWAGSVELHLKTSDWNKHRHSNDQNYNNTALHVVWDADVIINSIPVLQLNGRVPRTLLIRYEALMEMGSFIACESVIDRVNDVIWKAWKTRLAAERLLRKSERILKDLSGNQTHWEQICWVMMARSFGSSVNSDAFEAIARSLPLQVLGRHRENICQLEALLLGQANLLQKRFRDSYPIMLRKEFQFLRNKYQLKPVHLPVHFLRMRPGNFPTIRLVQLAALLSKCFDLFAMILSESDLRTVQASIRVSANDYWHYHYRPDELSPFKEKQVGQGQIDNAMINAVAPLLFAYGEYHNDQRYKDKAIRWLEETTPELNRISKKFKAMKIPVKSAFDSQALLELKTCYCDEKRCLSCSVGNSILKPTGDS